MVDLSVRGRFMGLADVCGGVGRMTDGLVLLDAFSSKRDIRIWQLDNTLFVLSSCCDSPPYWNCTTWVCLKCYRQLLCGSVNKETGVSSELLFGATHLNKMWLLAWTGLKSDQVTLTVEW